MAEFSKPQRGQTRSEASSQARTPALRAARPPKMAKVTRPDPTESWRATVNRALPSAEAAKATPTAVRVDRSAAGRRPGLDRKTFTVLTLPGRGSDGEPDGLPVAWACRHAPGPEAGWRGRARTGPSGGSCSTR